MPTTITISEFQIPDCNFQGTTCKLRRYYDRDWQDVDGTWHAEGVVGSSTGFFDEISGTLSSNTITIPAFPATPTDNGQIGRPTEIWQLWDQAGTARNVIFEGFIPSANPTITFGALQLLNQGQTLFENDKITRLDQWIQSYINTIIGLLRFATSVIAGWARLSVAAANVNDPIAVGDNDRRVGAAYNVKATAIGAAGDGTINDRAALNTLVNTTLQISGAGGEVYFPPGTYSIQSNITFPANVKLTFDPHAMLKPATGVTITILGQIAPTLSQIFTNALAAQGTISFTGNSALSTIFPQWWGAKGDDSTESGPAEIAAIVAADASIKHVTYPSGTYRHAVCPNFGFSNLTVQALGQVGLKHTGAGNILKIKEASAAAIYNVSILGNFQVYGNASSDSTGVLIESVQHSRIELNGRGAPATMFTVKWTVGSSYDLKASTNEPGSWLGPQPITGVTITSNGGGNTQDSRFHLIVEGVKGIGIDLPFASGCTFSGTSESNGIGLRDNIQSLYNTFDNLDFEGNITFESLGANPVSAATNASPVSLTFTVTVSVPLATGDRVTVSGGTGNWAAINGTFTATVTGATFTIPVDSTTFGALTGTVVFTRSADAVLYGSGHTFNEVLAISQVTPNIDLVTSQSIAFKNGEIRSILTTSSSDTDFDHTQFSDNASLGILGTGSHRRRGCTKINSSSVVTGRYSDIGLQVVEKQMTPFTITTSRSFTAAELLMREGHATPPGGGATYTVPTGTNMENGVPPSFNDDSFKWTIINLSATDIWTIAASAGHTIIAGSLVVPAATSAIFKSRKSATNTWITSRQT